MISTYEDIIWGLRMKRELIKRNSAAMDLDKRIAELVRAWRKAGGKMRLIR
jgi:steroid 5-alpha reductase family enzyme